MLFRSEGDVITAQQGIVELETDKAVAEVPSPKGGRVTKVHVKPGDSIGIGGTLVTLDEATDGAATAAPSKPAAPKAAAALASPAPAKPAPAKPARPCDGISRWTPRAS